MIFPYLVIKVGTVDAHFENFGPLNPEYRLDILADLENVGRDVTLCVLGKIIALHSTTLSPDV